MVIPDLASILHAIVSLQMTIDEDTSRSIFDLIRRLTSGMLNQEDFLAKIVSIERFEITTGHLKEEIFKRADVDPDFKCLLKDIKGNFTLWLLANLPETWVEEILHEKDLLVCFPAERVVSINDDDSFLSALHECESLKSGATLLVDWNARRANYAIRHGWDVAIYLDAARLRRDLELWRILS